MNSNQPIFLPAENNANRQTCILFAILGTVFCILTIAFGLLVVPLALKYGDELVERRQQESISDRDGQIAFVSNRDGNPEIYVINADGTNVVRLTNNAACDFAPAWSPDGRRIAFYSERDGNAEIYVMDADGSNQTRLTRNLANDYAPAWSPDGTKIAFHSHRFEGSARIFVMNADGSSVRRITDPAWDDWAPVWSPDGTKILFNSSRYNNGNIWVMNADGSEMKILTRHAGDDWWPDWSPDGMQIVFHSDRDGGFNIYKMKSDGTDVLRLTYAAGLSYDPAWSPDGESIAFSSDRSGNVDVWAMNTDGSGASNVTDHPADDWSPAWRPGGPAPLLVLEKETTELTMQEKEPVTTARPGTNLALGKQVQISRVLASNPAKMAVDGDRDNWWGAGAFAPQWIEIDLGASYVVGELKLLPSQNPRGRTIHRLLVKGPATDNEYLVLHTFEGVTADSQWLFFTPPDSLIGIRYVRIETTSSPSWVSWREIEVIAGE